jgi:hypothetical protein
MITSMLTEASKPIEKLKDKQYKVLSKIPPKVMNTLISTWSKGSELLPRGNESEEYECNLTESLGSDNIID